MKPSIPKNIFLIFLLAVPVIGFVVFLTPQSNITPNSATSSSTKKDNNLTTYTSKDLKISFEYPANWYLDEKDLEIMITSYKTKIGENKIPKDEEFKLFLSMTSLCQDSLEKNLIYGGCGENQKVLNVIQKKEISALSSGNTFYKLLVKYPDKSEIWSYYLEKGDKILQISKTPDPSQFEKEFEDLVNSVKFLD